MIKFLLALCIIFSCSLYAKGNEYRDGILDIEVNEGELIEKSFIHNNQLRNYTIYLPEGYNNEKEWPLIINFHGYTGDVSDQIVRTKMLELADEHGFLIAYPAGLTINRDAGILPSFIPASGTGWSVPGFSDETNELVFVDSLLSQIKESYSVDTTRIHTTGLSLGGYMAFYIATQKPNIIASFASVAGHMTNEVNDLLDMETQISGLFVHGTADIVTSYNGLANEYPSVVSVADILAAHNNCNSNPDQNNLEDIDTSDNTTVTLFEFSGCDSELSVKLYRVNNGGHRWPGSGNLEVFQALGNNSLDLNTSNEIFEFFNNNSSIVVSDEIESISYPKDVSLSQNYPNPFNPSTNISFELPQASLVQLKVYNLLGQEVVSLVDARLNSGSHSINFDASKLTSGLYIYRLVSGDYSSTRKMLLIK